MVMTSGSESGVAAGPRGDGSPSATDLELILATEALESAIDHLRHAWTAAAGRPDARDLSERLTRAAHLAQSANRMLNDQVLL